MTIPIDVAAGAAYSVVGSEDPEERMNIRQAIMCLWDVVQMGKGYALRLHHFDDDDHYSLSGFLSLLLYGIEHPTRKKRTPMKVDDMVARWIPIIKGLSIAHDKATLDRCEFESEQHLTPLLAAPVKQLREFYVQLTAALKADPTVPFFVWAMFEAWGKAVLQHAPDAAVRELKDELAQQIADMVATDLQPDLPTAIAGALRWRDAETLEKIKTAVEKGGKPRLRGRESCLFLDVDGETVML